MNALNLNAIASENDFIMLENAKKSYMCKCVMQFFISAEETVILIILTNGEWTHKEMQQKMLLI